MDLALEYMGTAVDAALAIAVFVLSSLTYRRNRQEQQLRLDPELHVIGVERMPKGTKANTYRFWLLNQGLSPLTVEGAVDADKSFKLSEDQYSGEKKPLIQPGAPVAWDLWLPLGNKDQRLQIYYRNSQGQRSIVVDRSGA